MNTSPRRLRSLCPHCGQRESLTQADLQSRLRSQGMLKRDDQGDVDFLLQLARAVRLRLLCPACGSGGLDYELDQGDDWDSPVKVCAACGAAIPAERLELFPNSDLCAACQQQVDHGRTPDQHDDFCPRCGTRMIVRQRRASGLVGYEMICPACRR